jgi:membrane protein DedA with SNARE-associated domain
VDNDPLDAFGLGAASIGVAIGTLFLIALARSHATYWAGRGVVRGAKTVHSTDKGYQWWRSSIRRLEVWTSTRAAQRGLELVRRWGPFAVTFAFITFGVQTAVFAASGLIRMRYLRFTIATLPGALAWGIIWATVGLSAVWGAIRLVATSPWLLAGVVTGAILAGSWFFRRRMLRDAEESAEAFEALDPPQTHGRHADEGGRHVRSIDDIIGEPLWTSIDDQPDPGRPRHQHRAPRSEPARTDTARGDAARAAAARADTARSDSARSDSARSDSARSDSARSDSAGADD